MITPFEASKQARKLCNLAPVVPVLVVDDVSKGETDVRLFGVSLVDSQ